MSELELVEVYIRTCFRCEKMRAVISVKECIRRQTTKAPLHKHQGVKTEYLWQPPPDVYCRSKTCPQGQANLVKLGKGP